MSAAVSLTRATGVEPSSSPTRHRVGATICSCIWPEVGALQGAASSEIALYRRSRQHGAHARKLGGSPGAELGREPPLEDGVGDRLDPPALDFSDALVPGLRRFRFSPRCRKARARRRAPGAGDKLLRDHAADGQPDDRGPADAELIQKRREIARVVGHVVLIRAGFGKAVAALIIEDDAEVGREDLGDLGPDAEIAAERIDEDERRRVAPALVAISG